MNSLGPMESPMPHIPEPIPGFPGMPHSVHKALWTVLEYAGSLSAAGALLAEYALRCHKR